jgi:pyridoxal/pyridoxine/pyridoxamine kinase
LYKGTKYIDQNVSSSTTPSSLSFLPKTPTHAVSEPLQDEDNAFDLVLFASVRQTGNKTDEEKTATVESPSIAPINNPYVNQSLITLKFPYIEGVFVGVGDAFASLFISYLIKEIKKENPGDGTKRNTKSVFTVETIAVAVEKSVWEFYHCSPLFLYR